MDPNRTGWVVPDNIDVSNFDFGWRPDPYDPPYIHQFGTQWQKTGGPRWIDPGATDFKFQNCQRAVALPHTDWIIPDNIDTTSFDWSWHPDSTEEPYIYQFGTQHQKTGGPKYIDSGAVHVKYLDKPRATALPHTRWTIPEAISQTAKAVHHDASWHPDDTEEPYNYVWGNQWSTAAENATVIYLTSGAKQFKYMEDARAKIEMPPLDIVFVSNGESGAEDRFNWLRCILNMHPNKIHHINGVTGRENALYAAATIATTNWFWCIPAKLRVNPNFNWSWHPNPFIAPVHWITYAINPVNGLVYGHQAACCYYRQHILDLYATGSWGLDFTMSSPHDIYPENSGVAEYNSDEWITWRTAFREVVKLKYYAATNENDRESGGRLTTWLNVAEGNYSHWSLTGARDGINYYNEVGGDTVRLQKSFSWRWLLDRAATLKYEWADRFFV